jgi:hypothetical protein
MGVLYSTLTIPSPQVLILLTESVIILPTVVKRHVDLGLEAVSAVL